MSQSPTPVSEETARFHRIIEQGDVAELQLALKNGSPVNAAGRNGSTALLLAIASKDLEKVKLLINHGADPELTDDFNVTPLRHAVDWDFVDGVQFLLSLGVDRGFQPKYPLKKVNRDFELPAVEMPEALKQVMSDAEWKQSIEETRKSLRELDLNPQVEPVISGVQSVDVLRLFIQAGDDLNLAPNEVKRALLGLETGGGLRSAMSDYQMHKSPRFGNRNPERMDVAFWRDMIRTGGNAYSARSHFGDEEAFTHPGAVWCFDRFGSSLTQLEDGRFVQIGGEHEDYYDPDFFIYNDVVIHDGKGDFEIYGYPRDVFLPTDFHSATLCGDSIYVVGCLGYPEQRQQGFTPVYRLTLESWQIEAVKTSGEMPGWIHKHRARYDAARNTICIASGEIHIIGDKEEQNLIPTNDRFELDLTSLKWRKVK